MTERKKVLEEAQRIVIKIGTSTLTRASGQLNHEFLSELVRQVAHEHKKGKEILIVTSGAVGAGLGKLNLHKKPTSLPERQAVAAIGQGLLMEVYEKLFAAHGITVAQILLTRDDMDNRRRYLNARNTLLQLITGYKAVPVINENDTVATEELELRFGDNDTLSALVASLVGADLLLILSDVGGLYTGDPRREKEVSLIPVVKEITPEIQAMAGEAGTLFGSGGMQTKIEAARIVTRSGIAMILASGEEPRVIERIIAGEELGTIFLPAQETLLGRKRWIAFAGQPRGEIVIDPGAVEALVTHKKSLLPSGVVDVKGRFELGDLVRIVDEGNREVARGLSNFSADEVRKIMGGKTRTIAQILGYKTYDEVVHRNNLVCLEEPAGARE
ncbi:MAG: glutamate 5-kinase [Firmicutes bacterium]|nr:glutamate 5-kinase [Bacillota bacterium]